MELTDILNRFKKEFTEYDFTSKSRKPESVYIRYIYFYMCRTLKNELTYTEIGETLKVSKNVSRVGYEETKHFINIKDNYFMFFYNRAVKCLENENYVKSKDDVILTKDYKIKSLENEIKKLKQDIVKLKKKETKVVKSTDMLKHIEDINALFYRGLREGEIIVDNKDSTIAKELNLPIDFVRNVTANSAANKINQINKRINFES